MTALLRLDAVAAGYGGVPVVHDLDLVVHEGEVVTLVGANGAGKTTTLLAISGLVPLLGGSMEVLGAPVRVARRTSSTSVWKRARRGLAHVPEDRGLFARLTVAENLRLATTSSRHRVPDDELFSWFDQLEPLSDRTVGTLSGGEQQMVALARAIVGRPRLLVVDELSLGLAPLVVERLLPVLRTVVDATGIGLLVVEQHVQLVLGVADRAVLLRQGRGVFSGSAAELAARPELVEESYLG